MLLPLFSLTRLMQLPQRGAPACGLIFSFMLHASSFATSQPLRFFNRYDTTSGGEKEIQRTMWPSCEFEQCAAFSHSLLLLCPQEKYRSIAAKLRLELLNQLDGFDDRGDVKVGHSEGSRGAMSYRMNCRGCEGDHGNKSHRIAGSCNDPSRRPFPVF